MTAPIVRLDQKLSRAVDVGKGVRLEPPDLDLLASLGVFEVLHEAKAEYLKEQGRCRHARRQSIGGGNIGSIGTARPMESFAAHTSPSSGTTSSLDLNPHGRAQNKKFRPVVPVLPLLDEWLKAEYATYQGLPLDKREGRGWLVNYYGRGIQDVDSAWAAMLVALKLPTGREWRPYVLRHSLATLVRNRGAEKWDLKGYMGHDAGDVT